MTRAQALELEERWIRAGGEMTHGEYVRLRLAVYLLVYAAAIG